MAVLRRTKTQGKLVTSSEVLKNGSMQECIDFAHKYFKVVHVSTGLVKSAAGVLARFIFINSLDNSNMLVIET